MDKEELNQLYWLNKGTEQLQKELEDLRQKGVSITAILTGMPRGSETQDKIGDHVAEIMVLEDLIKWNLQKICYERNKLELYIEGIQDEKTKMIIKLRHINGMEVKQIANEMGISRQTVYRKYNEFIYRQSDSDVLEYV